MHKNFFISIFVILFFLGSCSTKEYSKQCISYCNCMKETCSSYEKYPYENKDQCLLACSKFNEQETSCWSYFCALNDSSMQEHLCEHSWGEFGFDECP